MAKAYTKCVRWTAEEHAILLKNLKTYPKVSDAALKTAERTGRTYAGVMWRINNLGPDGIVNNKHRQLNPKTNKTSANPISTTQSANQRQPVITYHNGTTRKAQVIINKNNLIVAKFDDVVITIEL